ncbi:MAG: hypothetical protein KPI85_01460 [cyanobacterium endosymbiont of Epithemia adnata isolate EadnSB Bon19]
MMGIIYNNTAVKTLGLILLYTAEEHKTIGVAMAESLAAIFPKNYVEQSRGNQLFTMIFCSIRKPLKTTSFKVNMTNSRN